MIGFDIECLYMRYLFIFYIINFDLKIDLQYIFKYSRSNNVSHGIIA